MFWYFLRNLTYTFFHVFFRRLQIKNANRVRIDKPMLITMNHPNSFMDTIAISAALVYPRTYYMARGDAFKKGVVEKILKAIGIVPIYRKRDGGGVSSIKKNLESFEVVYRLLDKKQKIIVLAEGISLQERRLQPIQKGTAKMAFGYLEQGGSDELRILPIGVNYSYPSKFRSDVYYEVGEAISVKDYYQDYLQNPAQAIVKLTQLIKDRMKPLVPTLLHKENDVLVEQLQAILKKEFIARKNLNYNNLEHQQQYWHFIIDKLNTETINNPEKIALIRHIANDYTKQLEYYKVRSNSFWEIGNNKSGFTFFNFLLLLIGFPVFIIGKFLNYIPYYYGKKVADKTCKDIEFHAAVNFGVGSAIWIATFITELFLLVIISKNWLLALSYIFIKISFGGLGLLYSPLRKKIRGIWRLKQLKKQDLTLYNILISQRNELVNYFL